MSLPRRIVPGTTCLLTRRCSERRFFLRPSKKINQINKFCLGVAAERTGMLLHNYNFLSNHYHAVVTDPNGNLPEFMHWLNEYIAKCVNAELGREEAFWAPGSYSAVKLVDEAALINQLIYVCVNPVNSGLVARIKDWPGAMSLPADMERPAEIVARPAGFFREHGPVPESVELKVSMPDSLGLNVAELERLVAEREQEIRDEFKARGQHFLGVSRILAQSPFDRPKTAEQRGGLSPRVACLDKWRRIEALQRLKSFLSAYRDALESFMAGERDVVFPYGTYAMRVRFAVMCNGP